MSETKINNCFKKVGFKVDEHFNLKLEDANEVEYHAVADVLKTKINFDKYAYVKCDGFLQAKESYSDEFVKESLKDPEIQVEEEETEAESNSPSSSSISNNEASDHLNSLINFFLSKSEDYSEFIDSLLKMKTSVVFEKKKQSSIDDYLIQNK